MPRRAGGQAGLTDRETLVAREAISTGLRSDGLACYGILVCGATRRVVGDPNFYRNVWTPAQQQAGVAFSLYDLRHTFSSGLLAAGIPLIEVSAWMGHGLRAGGHEITNTTTRVYAHTTGACRQAALDELASMIAGTDPGRAQCATCVDLTRTTRSRGGVLSSSFGRGWAGRISGACGSQPPAAASKKVTAK